MDQLILRLLTMSLVEKSIPCTQLMSLSRRVHNYYNIRFRSRCDCSPKLYKARSVQGVWLHNNNNIIIIALATSIHVAIFKVWDFWGKMTAYICTILYQLRSANHTVCMEVGPCPAFIPAGIHNACCSDSVLDQGCCYCLITE